MNKNIFLSLFILLCPSLSVCQISKTFVNIDSLDKPIIFYGYDYSHLKFVSKRWTGSEMTNFISKLNTFLVKEIPKKRFCNFTGADSVVYNFLPTENINKNIIDSNVVTILKPVFPADSLQNIINNYNFPDTNGTGCIVFFDFFDRKTKITSAYLLLFELKTRKIIITEHIQNFDGNSYNRLSDWHAASMFAVIKLFKRLSWSEATRQYELDIISTHYSPDTTAPFKPTIFKTTRNELPVTFGFNPVIGISSSLLSGGVHINADVFHILIGYRYLLNPLAKGLTEAAYDESAFYIGYRFRKNKYAVSLGSGIGKTEIICTEGGLSSDCENFIEESVSSVPIFIEYAYFPVPVFGFTLSVNATISDRVGTASFLFGIKFGLARNWYENKPYNK